MARSRQRACLQEGLRLDLNRLARSGLITRGFRTGPRFIQWTNSLTGQIIAAGYISADLSNTSGGQLTIKVGSLNQTFYLAYEPRHFGGGQWYFICPRTRSHCSAVWKPPGATYFASRQAWGHQVAYSSQFQSRTDRALNRARAIRTNLGGPDWATVDEFDPPKPKWMRWRTYNRQIEQSRDYEAIADERLFRLIARWGGAS